MLKKIRNWLLRRLTTPVASLVVEPDGLELWISSAALSRRHISATEDFLRHWFGSFWTANVVYSRDPIQEFEGSAAADRPLREALQSGDGLGFVCLLAEGYTSVCAQLESAIPEGPSRVSVIHEEEGPAFRIQIPNASLPAGQERDFIEAVLADAGIAFHVWPSRT